MLEDYLNRTNSPDVLTHYIEDGINRLELLFEKASWATDSERDQCLSEVWAVRNMISDYLSDLCNLNTTTTKD